MAEKLTRDLDIIQNSEIEITVDPMTSDLNIIQKLDDEPNDVGGLSAAELKAKFDEAGNIIKTYINDSLVPQVLSEGITEAQRQANEAARQSAETARVSDEAGRVSAETGRVSAENARLSAESARQTAEEARDMAEVERNGAEEARENQMGAWSMNQLQWGRNDSARERAEENRQLEETVREMAESDRVSAEGSREIAESGRVSAEGKRVQAESARETAESARVSAENARETAETQRQAEQAAFFQGVSAQAVTLEPGAEATAQAAPEGGSFKLTVGVPQGIQGIQGPKGDTGAGLEVLGLYGTLAELKAAHPAGSAGEAYAVGTAEENAIYVWGVDVGDWVSIGTLRGPKGDDGDSIVPTPTQTQFPQIFGLASNQTTLRSPSWFELEATSTQLEDGYFLQASSAQGFPKYLVQGEMVPVGGTYGQVLTKTEDGAKWQDAPTGGDSIVPTPYKKTTPQILTVDRNTTTPMWHSFEQLDSPTDHLLNLAGSNSLYKSPIYYYVGYLPQRNGVTGQVFTKTDSGAQWADPPDAQQVWSTTPQKIGTWIDGKDRYRCAVHLSNLNLGSVGSNIYNMATLGIPSTVFLSNTILSTVTFKGSFVIDDETLTVPGFNSNWEMGLSAQYAFESYLTQLHFKNLTNSSKSLIIKEAYLIVEYTVS